MNRSYTVLNCLLVVFFSVASGTLAAEDKELVAKSPDPEGFLFLWGNPEDGQRAFTTLKCIECHSVKNVDVPAPSDPRWIGMELAFDMGFVKRYEDIILLNIMGGLATSAEERSVVEGKAERGVRQRERKLSAMFLLREGVAPPQRNSCGPEDSRAEANSSLYVCGDGAAPPHRYVELDHLDGEFRRHRRMRPDREEICLCVIGLSLIFFQC